MLTLTDKGGREDYTFQFLADMICEQPQLCRLCNAVLVKAD